MVLRNQQGEAKLAEKKTRGTLDILGVELEEIDAATARKLDIAGGLKITGLTSGKLQRTTDLRTGFIITKVDGKPVKGIQEFTDYLDKAEGGVMLEGVYEDLPGTYYYAFGMD